MTSIAIPPITTAITLSAATRVAYLAALDAHFSRVGSPFGCQLHSSGNTLYIWPNADPLRWVYVLAVTSAANANGLTGWLDHSNDPTVSPSTLPENPTTWLSANRTKALTQHVTGIAHTKFIVHEYGDALFIQELHSGNTYFTKHYHVGEIYAPAFASATTLGMNGLGILGGTGAISASGSTHAFMSLTTTTNQLASQIALRTSSVTSNTIWGGPRSWVNMQTFPAVGVQIQTLLSPFVCNANTDDAGSTFLNLGFYKYLASFHANTLPGVLVEDAFNQTAYVCINVISGTSSTFARCQYGVTGIL